MVSKKQNTDFGIVMALALLVAGTICHIHILYSVTIVSLLITVLVPVFYTPFSWLWFKLAEFIELFFSKIILSVIFYIVVTPLGLLRRWFAKDNLQIQSFKKSNKSVFVIKNTTYKKEDLENQY